jgi:outer membrane immunogenic protein
MVRHRLASTALLALAIGISGGAAVAADLPARIPTKAAVAIDPATNWSGFYLGVNAGYGWGRSSLNSTVAGGFGIPANGALVAGLDTLRLSPKGFTGGGQAGYNWQVGRFVFGVEAEFDYLGLRSTQTGSGVFIGGGNFTVTNSVKTDWLFTARPRLGYAFDRTLIYVTGGLAVTEVKYGSSLVTPAFAVNNDANSSTVRAGWTAGAGLEYALLNNWSVKAEYLYADFGSVSMTSIGQNGALYNQSATLTTHIARGGINYKFGGPVVARY